MEETTLKRFNVWVICDGETTTYKIRDIKKGDFWRHKGKVYTTESLRAAKVQCTKNNNKWGIG
jgi:hypothetical protein